MQRVTRAILDSRGQPLAGVTVTVTVAGGGVAPIYADRWGVTPKANPFTNDANGTYEYFIRSGRYTEVFAKTGSTFEATDRDDVFIVDPITLDGFVAPLALEFMSFQGTGPSWFADGHHIVGAGTVRLKTPSSVWRNGWLEVIGSGSVAGKAFVADWNTTLHTPFVVTAADALVFETRLVKETASATTLRVGLSSADLASGDPAHGFYVRQIDSNNAFLVVRSGGADSGVIDLGTTLADIRTIRIVARNAGIRAFVDNVAKTEVTASIPSSQMLGFTAASTATGSGIGLSMDYVRVWAPR